MNFEWMKDFPDIEQHLSRDYKIIAEELGIENLIKLLNLYQKTSIYFTTAPITDLMRIYIAENRYKKDPVELARELGVSKKYVYDIIRFATTPNKTTEQNSLFEDGDEAE